MGLEDGDLDCVRGRQRPDVMDDEKDEEEESVLLECAELDDLDLDGLRTSNGQTDFELKLREREELPEPESESHCLPRIVNNTH